MNPCSSPRPQAARAPRRSGGGDRDGVVGLGPLDGVRARTLARLYAEQGLRLVEMLEATSMTFAALGRAGASASEWASCDRDGR